MCFINILEKITMVHSYKYLHGGTGKYGFASDFKFDHSDNLLMNINGEQRGTGAGTRGVFMSIKNISSSPLIFL